MHLVTSGTITGCKVTSSIGSFHQYFCRSQLCVLGKSQPSMLLHAFTLGIYLHSVQECPVKTIHMAKMLAGKWKPANDNVIVC